jgi:hypothetical protein
MPFLTGPSGGGLVLSDRPVTAQGHRARASRRAIRHDGACRRRGKRVDSRDMPTAGALRAALCICLILPALVYAEVSTTAREALETAKEIYVATERADGSRSAVAPVWFMYENGIVYFSTASGSHKARRLREGGRVYVAVGSTDGPAFEGWGTLVSDATLIDRMAAYYRRKYWIAWLGFFVPNKDRVAAGKTVIVKVTPAERAG